MLFSLSLLFLIFYISTFYMFFVSFFQSSFIIEYFLFSFLDIGVSLSFVFDFVSLSFFSSVSFITFVVFLYSIFYMENSMDLGRFSWLVFLFVASMGILVFSSNFFMTMIGWDGLGLVSFCLVIFYSNSSSLNSGLITVFSNRIGDVFFLISFIFLFMNKHTNWEFLSTSFISLFIMFIFFGSITKSAQIPFSAWLPAAMAAPTPVSSLVHSSTLVTAGVYVMVRFNYYFSMVNFSFFKVLFLMTMLFAGVCAIVENDLKKIVAMSTLSQLGMMMFILSMGLWLLSFLHMIIHAFFKSMLFLSTGSLMGQMEGIQDSRNYGNFFFSYSSFIFFVSSCFSLSGFPFIIGFYSKDLIISSNSFFSGFLYYYLFILGCMFTVAYSMRLMHEAYLKSYNFFSSMMSKESKYFFIPVMFLFMKCWFLGGFFYWFFLLEMNFFIYFIDLFVGIIILYLGLLMFYVLKFSYFLYTMLTSMIFMQWISKNGSSFFFKYIKEYAKHEFTWMEVIGGKGMFNLVVQKSNTLIFLEKMKLGSVILLMIMAVSMLTYFK